MRTDVSTGFEADEIERINLEVAPGYEVPDYKIDKATIVQAVAYDRLGNKGEVTAATYFVGYSEKDGYEGMNVLSIVTDPENLFDYENGIYVTGKEYDEYIKEYRDNGEWCWREEVWAFWLANYRNRGAKWEKEALCQFFNADGMMEMSQKCGIRIHGGASRGYNPKSLNLYARKKYNGSETFQIDFWTNGYYPSTVTLFQGGNDYGTKAKDYLIGTEITDLNVSYVNYIPCIMFLNGEYWGVYWLNEKYDKNYLEHYYGVKKDNVIMIKAGELEEGEEDDLKYYSKMREYCIESDLTKEENFQKVCEIIDIESYVDYYGLMIYLGRHADWPMGNFALWRTKKEEAGKYGDCKWRWMVFDLNSAGFTNTIDPVKYTLEQDEMFKNMMTNSTFREMLITQIEKMIVKFNYEKMKGKIMEFDKFMAESMAQNDKRFFGEDSGTVFKKEIKNIEMFFENREEYLQTILQEYK